VIKPGAAVVLCAALAWATLVAGTARASERSETLRRQTFREAYSLRL
jgi:hypothetical protein